MNLAVTHVIFLDYLLCRDGSSDNLLRWAACVRPKYNGRVILHEDPAALLIDQ